MWKIKLLVAFLAIAALGIGAANLKEAVDSGEAKEWGQQIAITASNSAKGLVEGIGQPVAVPALPAAETPQLTKPGAAVPQPGALYVASAPRPSAGNASRCADVSARGYRIDGFRVANAAGTWRGVLKLAEGRETRIGYCLDQGKFGVMP